MAFPPPLPPRNKNAIAYQPVDTSSEGYPKTIYLYTTPLNNQRRFLKKPIDIFAHWAICIDGHFYELTRNGDRNKNKKEPKYIMRCSGEQEWIARKMAEQRGLERKRAGCTWFSTKQIHYVADGGTEKAQKVWDISLQDKYVWDEQNCQVFIRLLVEQIGDPATKAEFPQFFDRWVKNAGISRDVSFLTIAVGGAAMAATLAAAPVDPTGVAFAGVAMSTSMVVRSSVALLTDRHVKEKRIEKAQKELREKLQLDRNLSR